MGLKGLLLHNAVVELLGMFNNFLHLTLVNVTNVIKQNGRNELVVFMCK